MTRPTSSEPTNKASPPSSTTSSSKRKGTRSVSTLTPSQLARKRANDREAQRAIRARTKEHIERLEQELEELRNQQCRDKTVQDLMRRNKALEDELRQLKESMGVSLNSSPYSASAGYEEVNTTSMPSPRMSPLPAANGGDFAYGQQYMGMPATSCEAWAATLPSSVPSPSSSVNTDEYVPAPAYIPTSVPSGMMHGIPGKDIKLDYDDMRIMAAAQGYLPHQHPHPQQHAAPPPHPQAQRPTSWNVYPGVYYDGSQACMTR